MGGTSRRPRDRRYTWHTMSAGEAPVKQAVKWLDDKLRDNPQADRTSLIDEASRRFDLSPLDSDFLYRHLISRGRTA